MLTTVIIGTCVSIQGNFVRKLANGMVIVRIGEQHFTGRPIAPAMAA